MPKYIIRWKANAANWPTDPSAVLAVWEGAIGGGTYLLSNGTLNEINWLSSIEGYAVMDAASKDAAMAMATPFFPYFDHEIQEAVPWDKGAAAILGAAKMAAERK